MANLIKDVIQKLLLMQHFIKTVKEVSARIAAADVLANLRPVTFVLRQELTLKVKQVKAKQSRVEKRKAKQSKANHSTPEFHQRKQPYPSIQPSFNARGTHHSFITVCHPYQSSFSFHLCLPLTPSPLTPLHDPFGLLHHMPSSSIKCLNLAAAGFEQP